jgi:uncharacterized membrane protein YdjX (TVP38/TMEM64 family)
MSARHYRADRFSLYRADHGQTVRAATSMSKARIGVVAVLAVLVGLVYLFDLDRYFDLRLVQAEIARLQALVDGNFPLSALAFTACYIAVAAVSLPGGALVLTLSAGAVFGLVPGSVLTSIGSTLGATLGCMVARFLLREVVEQKFPFAVERVNRGLREDGAYYLFALRLVPVFPFFLVNLAMGLTRLPLRTFFWVSQLGMLPATIVYVNAGTQLAKIRSAGDVLTPEIAGSLALLGLFPLLGRKIGNAVLRWHRKPS